MGLDRMLSVATVDNDLHSLQMVATSSWQGFGSILWSIWLQIQKTEVLKASDYLNLEAQRNTHEDYVPSFGLLREPVNEML